MSKKKQDARFKKYGREEGDFYDLADVKRHLRSNIREAQRAAELIQNISNLNIASKKGSLYYEAFDLDTRGDVFRIEVHTSGYGIQTKFYIDGKEVANHHYVYDYKGPQVLFDGDTRKIVDLLPLQYRKPEYRDYRNNPSKQAIGGLLLAGLFGYAFMKRPR